MAALSTTVSEIVPNDNAPTQPNDDTPVSVTDQPLPNMQQHSCSHCGSEPMNQFYFYNLVL